MYTLTYALRQLAEYKNQYERLKLDCYSLLCEQFNSFIQCEVKAVLGSKNTYEDKYFLWASVHSEMDDRSTGTSLVYAFLVA